MQGEYYDDQESDEYDDEEKGEDGENFAEEEEPGDIEEDVEDDKEDRGLGQQQFTEGTLQDYAEILKKAQEVYTQAENARKAKNKRKRHYTKTAPRTL